MKQKSAICTVACLLGVMGISSAFTGAALPVDSVKFYYGSVKYTSPDGNTSYGESTSLVKRTISPLRSTITEDVIQPTSTAGQAADEFITTISERGNSNTFDSTDAGRTFNGTMIFSGNDWKWNAWTYDIALTSGGKIIGQGSLVDQRIQTQKTMLDASGNPTMKISEDLPEITAQKYAELRTQLLTH